MALIGTAITVHGQAQRLAVLCCLALFLASSAAAEAGTRCKLTLSANSSSTGSNDTVVAQLSCTGPVLKVAADPALLPLFDYASGVAWQPSGCGKAPSACWLALCSVSPVTFEGEYLRDEMELAVCWGVGAYFAWLHNRWWCPLYTPTCWAPVPS